MRPATAAALLSINRRFYHERAAAFAAKRKGPWPGFSRVLTRIPEHVAGGAVLDVGCGEGRFGVALHRMRADAPYVGVDLSEAMLGRARSRDDLPDTTRLVALDCARHPEALPARADGFAGVVALGLLHHVPQEPRRAALLRAMAARVARGGLMALTLWRFRSLPRFGRLELDWIRSGVDPEDLEPGDALLSFAGDPSVPRYCHFVDEAEAERLTRAIEPKLRPVERFLSDGPEGEANEYWIFEHPR